jgi:DNA-directed RNA polymerase subunit RPC12/RpoP
MGKTDNYSHNHHCKCGKLICNSSIRCSWCDDLDRRDRVTGKNNPAFKKGLPHCIDCGKELSRYDAIRCAKCNYKYYSGKKSPNYNKPRSLKTRKLISKKAKIRLKNPRNNPMFGKRNFSAFKRMTLHNPMKKLKNRLRISKLAKIRLKNPKNCPNYIHGQGNFPYTLDFSKELKNKIRNRDKYKCQLCSKTQQKELKVNNRKLSIHHIDYNKDNCRKNNLIALCNKCNLKVNYNRDYWYAYFTYILEER